MDTQIQIDAISKKLDNFIDEYKKNNFSARQDFNKASNFTTKIVIPHYDALPSVCEVPELIESNGKLYICSTPNTWTIVGTQT